MNDDTPETDNVIPFPAPVERPRREGPTATERAGLAEEARRNELFEHLSRSLASTKPMLAGDQFVLRRNLRNLVYRLKDEGRLDPKQVARKARGPDTEETVRALEEYVLPQGIETMAELDAKHPKRTGAKRPAGYMRHALAAADLAGIDRRDALIALAEGSSFWPGADAPADDERRAAHEVALLLDQLPGLLNRIAPMERYFDLIERHEVLPTRTDAGVSFSGAVEFGWWDFAAIPAVRIATRWLDNRRALIALSGDPVTGPSTGVDFDAVVRRNNACEGTVHRRETFALGVARVAGALRPVGILGEEILVGEPTGATIPWQAEAFCYASGWNRFHLRAHGSDQAIWGAWRLADEGTADRPPGSGPRVKLVRGRPLHHG